jgi:hypothetical protein
MNPKKLRLEEVRVESFVAGSGMDERGTVNAHGMLLGTGPLKCPRTDFGPNCDTDKQTGPCGAC